MPSHSRDYEYEVVVLGGGPAGIAAACSAAESGCRVALLEGTPWLGGPIWRTGPGARAPRLARRWLKRLERSSVEVFDRTTAFAWSPPDVLHTERGDDVLNIGWHALILAVGAQELFLPFPGWTLPNVMGTGGLQLLGKTGWPCARQRVVVAGSGPLSFAAAAHLARHGARVTDILEQADWGSVLRFGARLPRLAPGKLWQAAGFKRSLLRTRFRTGCWPVAAHGTDRVTSVTFTNGSRSWTRACDYLACAFGLTPNLRWPMLLGCQIADDRVQVDEMQQTSLPHVYCAGEATGVAGVESALVQGQIAGLAAAGNQRLAKRLFAQRDQCQRFASAMAQAFALRDELRSMVTDKTIICRCEDVTWGAVKDHADLRSARLQTRCGMGFCQGHVCHGALRLLKGWPINSIRPPLTPTHIGSLVGMSTGVDERRG